MSVVRHLFSRNLLSSVLIALFLFSGSAFAYSPQALYDEVWKLVNARFVDESKNGQDWRIWRHRYDKTMEDDADAQVAIETMLASLNDRYTRYLDPEEFAEEGRSIKARLYGIGIQIGVRDNKIVVISPIDDTPADKAGVLANDEILEIDGKSTQGMSVKDAANMIRGEKGTAVKLLIKRGDKAAKPYDIVRDEIKLKSVELDNPFKLPVPNSIGYIKLSTFLSSTASAELRNAMKEMGKKDGYIIDLRSNPGGLLTNAIQIADFFLDGGSIVSTVDRDGYKDIKLASKSTITEKPLVILIDGGSASASEILSGALKDTHRALLVGEKSFGKGLVQEINQLPGGSGMNITTQRYLTPNDIDINKLGIQPDIAVTRTEEDFKNKKDPQLVKALSVLEQMIKGKSMKTLISENMVAEINSETKTEDSKSDAKTPAQKLDEKPSGVDKELPPAKTGPGTKLPKK
ncbi:MAG: S41 family peptidase [Vampirovibrionales bacterium]|nr:S41 family peptidase [Vampirovibrionales bacterium]